MDIERKWIQRKMYNEKIDKQNGYREKLDKKKMPREKIESNSIKSRERKTKKRERK